MFFSASEIWLDSGGRVNWWCIDKNCCRWPDDDRGCFARGGGEFTKPPVQLHERFGRRGRSAPAVR